LTAGRDEIGGEERVETIASQTLSCVLEGKDGNASAVREV
jgi:hypothetical protein